MFQSLSQVDPNQSLDCDLCIIGAGAAGIIIANKFKDAALRTCLIEAGGLDVTRESQALYRGVSHGYADLWACRLRYFGGTTNHWTGYCRPPEEEDLNARPWEPLSGWPLPLTELNRYLPEAMDIVEIPNQFDSAYWAEAKGAMPLNLPSTAFREKLSLVGPPVRFKEKYRSAIDHSRSVTCLLDANVVELLPSQDGTRIEQIALKTLDGKAWALRAKRFVLACGGIENARVLLDSTSRSAAGVGNANDLVGRFFSDHCLRVSGSAVLTRPPGRPLLYELGRIREQQFRVHPHLQTDIALAAKLQLPRVVIRLEPEPSSRVTRLMENITGFWQTEVPRAFRIVTFVEPLPLAENRVTLLEERDALGMRRAQLVYKPGDLEIEAIDATLKQFATAVGAAGRGRVQIDADTINAPPINWGYHHYSTTKMHSSPRQGVVDTDCRVHGMQNLYVAGSSVFPTAGLITPTMTIVALALRLADKLKEAVNE